jgi:uncharacterized protein (TIGR03067 family)
MRRVVVVPSVLTILACFSTAVPAQDDKTAREELKLLQGVWKPVAAEQNGKELDPKEDDWTLQFDGDKVTQLRKGDIHVEGKVEVATPSNTSKRAYWKHTNPREINNSVLYFFIGPDTLVTCWNGSDENIAPWPTGFATGAAGTGVYLVVWKRQK